MNPASSLDPTVQFHRVWLWVWQETIAQLTAELEEDRYQLEKIERAEQERLAQKTCKAATTIQRYYRGYRYSVSQSVSLASSQSVSQYDESLSSSVQALSVMFKM